MGDKSNISPLTQPLTNVSQSHFLTLLWSGNKEPPPATWQTSLLPK